MSGKKSGLNLKLRKLLARIQREFDYPKVINVRCKISAPLRTWRDPNTVVLHGIEEITAAVHDLRVHFPIALESGALGGVATHRMVTLEEIETSVHGVTCWQANEVVLHRLDPRSPSPDLVSPDLTVPPPTLVSPSLEVRAGTLKSPNLRPSARLVKNMGMARALPMRLPMIPFADVSKKLQIRYRTNVFKLLNVKPNQVKFVGVVTNLPPAPLRLLEVVSDKQGTWSLARVTGVVSPDLAGRIWVIVQMNDQPRHLNITMKEE